MIRMLALLLIAIGLGGCWQITEPNPDITLKQAMLDVADSIQAVRERTSDRQKAGLIVDEVTVVFNISSKRTAGGELGIGASAIPIAGGGLSANAKSTSGSEDLAGNTITVKLKNISTWPSSAQKTGGTGGTAAGSEGGSGAGAGRVDPRCYLPNPPADLSCPPFITNNPKTGPNNNM
ncbi:hypothetical protein [Ancylobacter sp. SL191]|uniref:hypothetical protein n=1 Tax=Ancylobacter sp. SL191 TaxID=2995166 RepID=UPI002271EDBB|nr:hypothetical protein [Ancylobacter sp. SL191]WAC26275.1 hypothetical protein OU996_14805 [Ancylobacter sp. SL191]